MKNWEPISTAPDLERVLVAGIQPRNGNTIAYWWWHEDVCDNGKAFEHPTATHWFKPDMPAFPHSDEVPE